MQPEIKQQFTLLLQLGCDRETAAAFCGVEICDIDREIDSDADWLREIRHAEARFEVAHLQKLQSAAKDNKNWRISVWWLERRWPERYARKAYAVTSRELRQFIDHLAEELGENMGDQKTQQRIERRLKSLLDALDGIEDVLPPPLGEGRGGGEP